jgi:hypothetical protein
MEENGVKHSIKRVESLIDVKLEWFLLIW